MDGSKNLIPRGSEEERVAMMRTSSSAIPFSATLLAFTSSIIICSSNLPAGDAIWLSLQQNATKCISDELRTNVVVLADYIIVPADYLQTPAISVKVTSPDDDILHQTENVTNGQFAFTSPKEGIYLTCFTVAANGGIILDAVTINFEWKVGIAAKDWKSIAKKEKLEGIDYELRRMEGAVDAIHENLIYLKDREADMRKVSEATNGKVAWLSFFSLGVCIVVSTLQVWYLKQFFQRKKLL